MLERALRHEPNSFDIRRLMDDCEDALEDEGGDTLVEDAASATAANGNGGGATANGDAVGLSEEDAACVAFAESVMTAAAEAWGDSGGEHGQEAQVSHGLYSRVGLSRDRLYCRRERRVFSAWPLTTQTGFGASGARVFRQVVFNASQATPRKPDWWIRWSWVVVFGRSGQAQER